MDNWKVINKQINIVVSFEFDTILKEMYMQSFLNIHFKFLLNSEDKNYVSLKKKKKHFVVHILRLGDRLDDSKWFVIVNVLFDLSTKIM